MRLIVKKNPTELAKAAADFVANRIKDTLKKQDRFTIALSGGSTPKALHELLAKPPYVEQIPWAQLHIFWGDERYVPIDDEQSNAGMAYDTLLGHVYTPETQIHVWRTDLEPNAAAADYDRILHDYFGETAPGVDSPGVDSPGVDSPGVDSPGVDSPGVDSPGVDSPGVDSPGVDSPGVDSPGVDSPGVDSPGVDSPGVDSPGVDSPGVDSPGVDSPGVDSPGVDSPGVDSPGVDSPGVDSPGVDSPGVDSPGVDSPGVDSPGVDSPGVDSPGVDSPGVDSPGVDSPGVDSPGVDSPGVDSPGVDSPTFDLVLLGMGDDGHTLSLFPGTDVVHEKTAWTKAYFLTQQNMVRLTLTAPIVNRASCIVFLVAGPKKAEPLKEVLEGSYNPDKYPSQEIKPADGDLVWLIDEKAAALLNKK